MRVAQLYKFLKMADQETEVAYAMELPDVIVGQLAQWKDQFQYVDPEAVQQSLQAMLFPNGALALQHSMVKLISVVVAAAWLSCDARCVRFQLRREKRPRVSVRRTGSFTVNTRTNLRVIASVSLGVSSFLWSCLCVFFFNYFFASAQQYRGGSVEAYIDRLLFLHK